MPSIRAMNWDVNIRHVLHFNLGSVLTNVENMTYKSVGALHLETLHPAAKTSIKKRRNILQNLKNGEFSLFTLFN